MQLAKRVAAFMVALVLLLPMPRAWAGQALSPDDLASEAAVLIDADTGTVLFSKNADRAMYPASTTKIMTCLLALEYGHLDETVVIAQEAGEVPKDSSLVPVKVGEEIVFRDLLYGLMLMSGNDAANAIAVIVAGSVDAFVERMNQKAEELGMRNTHFANAHGYHADDHYTSARDLAILTFQAMKNEEFRAIVSTPGYIIPPSNKRAEKLKILSTNLMLLPNSEYYDSEIIGVKTGFTKAAGQTFVGAAKRNGVTLIGVMMKSGSKTDSPERWQDTRTLMEYGFSQYENVSFADLYALCPSSLQVENASENDLYGGEMELSIANVNGDYTIPCLHGDTASAVEYFRENRVITLTSELIAPIEAGTIVGSVSCAFPEGETVSAALVASRTVEEQPREITLADFFPLLSNFNLNAVGAALKVLAAVLIMAIIVMAVSRSVANARRRKARKRRKGASRTCYRGQRDRYFN